MAASFHEFDSDGDRPRRARKTGYLRRKKRTRRRFADNASTFLDDDFDQFENWNGDDDIAHYRRLASYTD